MNLDQIRKKHKEIVDTSGEWTAHNIHLKDDFYTIGNKIIGDELKLRKILQMVADMADKPLNQLRVLDLACLEGMYGLELAQH